MRIRRILEKKSRLFVGIPISVEVKARINSLREKLRILNVDLLLVSVENLHFTLKFLGTVAEDKIAEIETKLGQIALANSPFLLSLEKVGSFPSAERIDVIWIGMKDAKLVQLMRTVREKLQYLRKDEHSEVPHLTIARLKSAKNKNELLKVMEEFKEHSFGQMKVDRFCLYESELTAQGLRYKVVKEFRMG